MTDATTMTACERDKLTREIECMDSALRGRLRRDRLRAEGICTVCGHAPAAQNRAQCEQCIERQRQYRRKNRMREAARQTEELSVSSSSRAETKKHLSIADINRMAAERGISYGQMVLKLEEERCRR